MQDTLAYLEKKVFAGIKGTIPEVEERRHDYNDESWKSLIRSI
jgi:hypothetical protein